LMVPVFTPFNEDKQRTINFDVIEKYAAYLKQKGTHGVVVNGYIGEGTTLRVEERKRLAEEWFRVTRKHQLKMLLNIGGTDIADVYELAEHAEKLGVDGILVLADAFYRPIVEEDLLYYIRDVAKRAPSLPILYYHAPMVNYVHLKMWRFYELAEKEITNFGGIYYADFNWEHAAEALRADRTIILGVGKCFLGALTSGFEAISTPFVNLYPELYVELYDHILNYRLKEALLVQDKLIKHIREFYVYGEDWIVKVKEEFNKVNSGFKLGVFRKPEFTKTAFRRY